MITMQYQTYVVDFTDLIDEFGNAPISIKFQRYEAVNVGTSLTYTYSCIAASF